MSPRRASLREGDQNEAEGSAFRVAVTGPV